MPVGIPKIGARPLPEHSEIEPESIPIPPTAAQADVASVVIERDRWIENDDASIPPPPTYILEQLKRREQGWRWLSAPQVQKKGMREYTVYEPTAKDRDEINAGRCGAGIRISSDNRVMWREDAFLGVLSQARQEERRRRIQERSRLQSQSANAQKILRDVTEAANQAAGSKVMTSNVDIQQWVTDKE